MSERPKVLLVSTNADRAGAPKHIAELLSSECYRSNFDLALSVGKAGFLTEVCKEYSIPVHIIPQLKRPLRPLQDLRAYRGLVALIRQWKPNMVHAHSSKAGVLARLAASRQGVKTVFTAHGWPFAPGIGWKQRAYSLPVERYLARRTDAIITVSAYDKQLALKKHVARADQLFCIHNGLADDPRRARPDAAGTVNIIMVARFVPQKDHATLISAVATLGSQIHVHLVGDGPGLEAVRTLATTTGVTDRLRFHGEVADVPELLAQVHLFVLASRWEGLPISILEAMRCGLPIVASDVGGVSEAVRHGENGYLVGSGEAQELTRRIDQLVGDAALRARMGEAGRRRFETLFRAEGMVARTLNAYWRALWQG